MREPFDLKIIVEPLLQWFAGHARSLPWRQRPEPYRVWVSEIMLQQTRVEAVKPYYERFMSALPDVKSLAECPEEELLKLWEGLGYYNRVRNMQCAAQQVCTEYGGQLPADYEALQKLKGIGHYTAGAIASIAYGIAVPAVDGNVLRVISRVTADDGDIMKQKVRVAMENDLTEIIPADAAGAFNQALMELGATVCLPNGEPLCEECPWRSFCRARQQGRIGELPVKSRAKPRKVEERTVLIIRAEDKVMLRRRPPRGLLAGLYELPNLSGHLTMEEAVEYAKEQGLHPLRICPLREAKHIFSHIEWRMIGYSIIIDETEGDYGDLLFVSVEETEARYPIPAAFSAYAQYLKLRLGNEKYKDLR
ncbi:MAG: A/G-specific adenine glycosylase [Lachnospiraceae bacterium]|nr:A/G-specific adenine glycosylase [Lachnospiraceae bacterium]